MNAKLAELRRSYNLYTVLHRVAEKKPAKLFLLQLRENSTKSHKS